MYNKNKKTEKGANYAPEMIRIKLKKRRGDGFDIYETTSFGN